ncbi:hypothetical protein PIB30_083570 [Stylosanthes scabra]|uniref:Uncharacterized protein n=1 Tax=Stylosanthes scabra TaxID=79078 RepID=A0ABU6QSZ3_9FABA|nr:hypothetical protein [Stylosanthes scabra]
MGWGFSLRIFQTFQVQVQAWKVAKCVVYRCGLDSPDVRVFRFYASESSVHSAAISAERVRGMVSHIGVNNEEMKLEEQEMKKWSILDRTSTPRRPRPHLRDKQPTPWHGCQRLGVAQQPSRTPRALKANA